MPKVNGQGHWERKSKKNRFLGISLSNVDRFTSNQDQNDDNNNNNSQICKAPYTKLQRR